MISPNRHACLPSCKREAQPPLLGMCMGDVSGTEELSAGPGRGWSERTKGHGIHYIQGGAAGAPHRCSYRGGQDGQTVTEGHGKGRYGEGNHK